MNAGNELGPPDQGTVELSAADMREIKSKFPPELLRR